MESVHEATSAPSALALAQQRAMPVTRMLDYGMDPWDARALLERTTAGEPWDQAAEALAEPWLERASVAERSGRRLTAHESYRRGAAALNLAQMAFNADGPRKQALYARLTEAAARAAALGSPAVERLQPPFGTHRLAGWLVRPLRTPAAGTVIVLGGLSGWGTALWHQADALAARGLAALLAEGPGQGEPRLLRGTYLAADVHRAYSMFVSEVLARPELGGAVGIWGNSFGGLFAALTASRDPRVGACCVNGGPAAPALPEFPDAREQIFAAVGSADPALAARVLDGLRYDPGRDPIPCPVLVLHGGRDPLVSLEDLRPFQDGGPPRQSTLRVWDDGEHTLYNHAVERNGVAADWFVEQLAAGTAQRP